MDGLSFWVGFFACGLNEWGARKGSGVEKGQRASEEHNKHVQGHGCQEAGVLRAAPVSEGPAWISSSKKSRFPLAAARSEAQIEEAFFALKLVSEAIG